MQTKKATIDKYTKKKRPKHNTKNSHRITKEKNKRRREEKKTKKKNPKQLRNHTYQ